MRNDWKHLLPPPLLVPEFYTFSFLFLHSFLRPYPQTPSPSSCILCSLSPKHTVMLMPCPVTCPAPLSASCFLHPPPLPSLPSFWLPNTYPLSCFFHLPSLLLIPPPGLLPFQPLSLALGSRSLVSLRAFSDLPTSERQTTTSH